MILLNPLIPLVDFMQLSKEQIVKKVEILLQKFIIEFQRNPFEYFYEEDIRASLLTLLKEEINIFREFPTLNYFKPIQNSTVRSSIVKAEYPSHKRFDIALLNYQENKDLYNQPVFLAIEIKLGSHKLGTDRTAGLQSDIEKLRDNIISFKNFIGVAIYFCQTGITQNEVNDWYKGLSFKLTDTDQITFNEKSVYGIIVPSELSGKIYSICL